MVKIKRILVLHFTLLFFILNILSFFILTEATPLQVEILKYLLLLSVVWVVYSARQFYKWTHIYLIFIFTMCIFLFNRVFLDILGLFDFTQATRFAWFNFPIEVQKKLLLLFISSLVIIHTAVLITQFYYKNKISPKRPITHNKSWEKIGALLFFSAIPAFLMKAYLQLKVVLSVGYLAVYTEIRALHYPWWTVGSGTIMLAGFSVLLVSMPPKKRFIIYSVIFMLLQLVGLMKGNRGTFIISLIFIIWFYYRFYSKEDLNLIRIFLLSIPIIVLAQYMAITRLGGEFEISSFGELLISFISEQGVSILVPEYLIHYEGQFVRDGLPYILTRLTNLGGFTPTQSIETINNFNILGDDLTYFLRPDAYLSGEGIGGSFIAELYDLPLFVMFLMLLLLGFFIIHYDRKVRYSGAYLILSYVVVFQIFKMPRDYFFPKLNLILILLFIYYLLKLISRKKYV